MELKHSCYPNGDIVQEVLMTDGFDGAMQRLSRQVIQTSDAAVRKSLIALGWTPPGQPTRANCDPWATIKTLLEEIAESSPLLTTQRTAKEALRVISGFGPRHALPPAPKPEKVRGPIDASYPLAYRLVTTGDGNGNDVAALEGLHIIDGQRRWVRLPTQGSTWAEDHIPPFTSI
jgi:hypothetical protein